MPTNKKEYQREYMRRYRANKKGNPLPSKGSKGVKVKVTTPAKKTFEFFEKVDFTLIKKYTLTRFIAELLGYSGTSKTIAGYKIFIIKKLGEIE